MSVDLTNNSDRLYTEASIRPHIIRGSIWMLAMRWSTRLLGLISTLVLARLLVPADFGMLAMAMLLIGFIEAIGQTGQQAALIQFKNTTREHYDTAWTMQVILSIFLGVAVVLSAPLAARYFEEPKLEALIQFLSLRVFIAGLENIGTVRFQRDLDFAKDFRFNVLKKFLPFCVTIVAAYALRSYWALAIGIVVGAALAVMISYVVDPYRPRLSLSKTRDIWSFSIWVWAGGIGTFLHSRLDGFVVGRIADPRGMGLYQLGSEIAEMVTGELIMPLSRALFPSYARISHDLGQLRDAYVNVLSVIAIIAISTSVGMALIAEDLIPLLLGEEWRSAASFAFWLSLTVGIYTYCHTVMMVFYAVGQAHRMAVQSWIRLLLMLPATIAAGYWFGLEGVAAAKFFSTFVLTPTYFLQVMQIIPLSTRQVVGVTWRPLIAAMVMAAVVLAIPQGFLKDYTIAVLALKIVVGALTFCSAQLLIWRISGAPSGAEASSLRFTRNFLRRHLFHHAT